MSLASRVTALAQAVGADIKALLGRALPSGGTPGQVLTKTTAADYAAGWAAPTAGTALAPESDDSHPSSTDLPSAYPLGSSHFLSTSGSGWETARPSGQTLTSPMRIETFRSATNGAVQRVTFRDITSRAITWQRTATANVWNPGALAAETPDRMLLSEFNDFVNTGSTGVWTQTVSGTASGWASVNGFGGAMGVAQCNPGTTTTGRAFFGSLNAELDLAEASSVMFNSKLRIPTLSTATDAYTSRGGLLDSATAEPVDGVYFRYSHALNSGKWQAVVRSNNVETATDTGVTVVINTWYELSVEVASGGSSVTFRINGVAVHTTAAGIPTGAARRLGWGIGGIKSAGTVNVPMLQADWADIRVRMLLAR